MAPSPTSRPARLLVLLTAITIALGAWAFWPGTETSIRLGLDLQGGTQVILQPTSVTEGASVTDEQLEQTVSIIRQRVDGLGVSEAEVTTQGTGDGAVIVVSVPGVNQDRVVELVQRTALLDFRPVWGIYNPAADPTAVVSPSASPSASPSDAGASGSPSATPSPSASPSATDSVAPSASAQASAEATPSPTPSPTATDEAAPLIQSDSNSAEFQQQIAALDCTLPVNYTGGRPDDPAKWLGTCESSGQAKYNLEPAFIRGTNVTGATAQLPTNGIGWVVSLEFDSEGAAALADASTKLSALPECGTAGANPVQRVRDRARRCRRVGTSVQRADPRRPGADRGQLHPAGGEGPRQRAQVRRAARDPRAVDITDGLADRRQRPACARASSRACSA